MSKEKHPIIAFYDGSGRDNKGRGIDDIYLFTNDMLEQSHDYIQWLFPLQALSVFNPYAPTLTEDVIKEFNNRDDLKKHLNSSVDRMEEFYFNSGRDNKWITKDNHNFLRITRILICLKTLGLSDRADDFFNKVMDITNKYPGVVSEKTYQFWENALI